MAISLQLQNENELVFVSITKKIAALMYNKLENPVWNTGNLKNMPIT